LSKERMIVHLSVRCCLLCCSTAGIGSLRGRLVALVRGRFPVWKRSRRKGDSMFSNGEDPVLFSSFFQNMPELFPPFASESRLHGRFSRKMHKQKT
jgi:hypothetical protein